MTAVAGRISPQDALADACAQAGLDASGASVLYDRSNTVYKLAGQLVVVRLRYAPGSSAWRDRLAISVQVTGWLHARGFPAVRPLDIAQPVQVHGYLVTFWHFVPASGQPWEDVDSLGRLLRRLHGLGDPPAELPQARPMSSLREDAERCAWLTDEQRSWVLGRAEALTRQYDETTWALGCGMIHGDAYADNVIHTSDGAVLADWDSVSYGPREQDIVPASIRHRFARPLSEWHQFCAAYGVDPDHLPGLDVLRQMRELRTLVPYIRSTGKPEVQAEVTRRIADLMSGTQPEPWQALNLAS